MLSLSPFLSVTSRIWNVSTQLFGVTRPSEIPMQSPLSNLPVEILLSLADFLTADDVACFSLCNRHLFSIFCSRTSFPLSSKENKISLLDRLARDLPRYFVCHLCYRLHKYQPSKYYAPGSCRREHERQWPCQAETHCQSKSTFGMDRLRMQSLCFNRSGDFFALDDIYYKLYFFHTQLAMKRFYHGPQYGISTEDMSYVQVRFFPYPKDNIQNQRVVLSSLDTHICPDHPRVILRVQRMIFVARHRRYLLYHKRDLRIRAQICRALFICRHIAHKEYLDLLNSIVRAHRDGVNHPAANYYCSWCGTSFRMEIHEDDANMALVITKWLSLGDGSTPDKPEWAMHSKIERWTNANNANDDNAPIRIEPHGRAGARACFEKSTTLPLENLRSRNFSYLTGHRYKTCMIKRDLTNWCIPRNVSKEGVSYWDRILGLQW